MPTSPSTPSHPPKPAKKPTTGDYVAKVIVFLMMASFGVVVNIVSYNDFVSIKDDLWLNSHGVLARNGSLYVHHGHRTESSLCAYYDTQQGKAYSKCIELWFPIVLIDEHSPQVIHYDPAAPEHISTSWGRQILFSRTFSLFVALTFAFVCDFGAIMWIVGKVTGKKVSDEPDPATTQPQTDHKAVAIAEQARRVERYREQATSRVNDSFRDDARRLSRTLAKIILNLQSNAGPNAAYANSAAAQLAPLADRFDRALAAHSREQAGEALNAIVEFMNDFLADTRKRKIGFGFRHWQAMRNYNNLQDIFRATKYRNASL
jgi:hypothetical protein